MFSYHWRHPIEYIAIPCFFYGILATLLAENFAKRKLLGKIGLTILIIALTILLSSPIGGMLWHYHDMQAGFFPLDWFNTMTELGFSWGLQYG